MGTGEISSFFLGSASGGIHQTSSSGAADIYGWVRIWAHCECVGGWSALAADLWVDLLRNTLFSAGGVFTVSEKAVE